MRYYRKRNMKSPVVSLCEKHGKEAVKDKGFEDVDAYTGVPCEVCKEINKVLSRESMLKDVKDFSVSSKQIATFINDVSRDLFNLLISEEKEVLKERMKDPIMQSRLCDILCGYYFAGNKDHKKAVALAYDIVFNLCGEKDESMR